MKKPSVNLKNLIAPTDSIALVVIIIGLLIAIFIQQIEVRLIGVSIAILGTVAFFMLISQRLKDFLDTRIFSSKSSTPPPDIKITEIQDSKAKRQVIEDLEESLDSDFDKVKKKEKSDKIEKTVKSKEKEITSSPKQEIKSYSDGDEGFKVVAKGKPNLKDNQKSIEKKISIDVPKETSHNTDEHSGMRIIGKKSAPVDEEIKMQMPKDEVPLVVETIVIDSSEPKLMEIPPAQADLFNIPEFDNPANTSYKELGEQVNTNYGYKTNDRNENPEKVKKDRIANCKKNRIDVPLSILMEDIDPSEQEPRKEFASFVSRALMVIRSMASTTTAAFLIVNLEKDELILETFVTDTPDSITENPKIRIGADIISQIVLSGKPEILTEINPAAELDLIPYYKKSVGVSSFIGLPVFYKNSVIGVLCADTDIPDAYDSVTVGFLGHFTKLIGSLVMSYTEKHELLQASRVLDAVNSLRKNISESALTIADIAESFTCSAANIFDFIELGIVCFDYVDGKWKVFASIDRTGESTPFKDQQIDIGKCMIGETINRALTITSTINNMSPVRVHNKELKHQQAYFVSVPLLSLNRIYGSIYILAKSKSNITNYDIKIFEALGEQIGSTLEHLHTSAMLKSSALEDPDTGLLNYPAYFKRLTEETVKTSEFGLPISVCTFQLDNYASFNPDQHRERYVHVIHHIITHIKNDLKIYDVFGKLDDSVFSIALIGLPLNEAQLWAERVRAEIARSVINLNKKKFSVTISAGVAEPSKGDTAEILLEKSRKALALASKKSNNVTIFA